MIIANIIIHALFIVEHCKGDRAWAHSGANNCIYRPIWADGDENRLFHTLELNLLKTFLSYPFLVLGVLEKGVGCLGGGDGVNIQQQVSQITKLAEHKKLFFLLPVKAPKVAG